MMRKRYCFVRRGQAKEVRDGRQNTPLEREKELRKSLERRGKKRESKLIRYRKGKSAQQKRKETDELG